LEEAEAPGEGMNNDDDFAGALSEAEDAANAKVVEERLLCVWSMFRSDWITNAFSNLSKIKIVLTTLSKD
jgi:hypothetical protein